MDDNFHLIMDNTAMGFWHYSSKGQAETDRRFLKDNTESACVVVLGREFHLTTVCEIKYLKSPLVWMFWSMGQPISA